MIASTKLRVAFLLSILSLSAPAQSPIVNAVRAAIAQNDLASAEQMARGFQARTGARPDTAAALSWLARGYLAANNLDRADAYATEAQQMASRFLTAQKLDADPWLPTAVGASIEVHAQVLAARGERPEAVAYLRDQLKRYAATSLPERISKNINLLNMEGKPAPALDTAQWLGATKAPSLVTLRGRPVLLFFWAHWCSDCKAEIGIIADLRKTFAAQRLAVVGPTRLYGYAKGGEDATPEQEKRYIEEVRGQFYAPLADMPVPFGAGNFIAYGASSTPTLVLVDRAGIVRWYHPGSATQAEIASHIREVLAK
jgi:thiol-disulfide isomerase/thioredoxin